MIWVVPPISGNLHHIANRKVSGKTPVRTELAWTTIPIRMNLQSDCMYIDTWFMETYCVNKN